ncbi:hypothetical protein BSL78_10277 [Apostichopus japonicus]|uniref:Uncharacterized protein n=1 Tax=Stichopus japonicus TaxID=307972 RepID=A0A2G8KXV4_STIJA|nr:hypothetical protein BSL78_10277 [Apostichopus japonicus]
MYVNRFGVSDGYSSSDSRFPIASKSIEVDDGEDVISEFADSERACSPTILPAPPSTLHDDSMCDVSETAPVMSRGPRRDEMEGTGDVPPHPTKQEEGEAELPEEQREVVEYPI